MTATAHHARPPAIGDTTPAASPRANRRADTREATVARVATIIREQTDPAWAAALICDFFEEARQ